MRSSVLGINSRNIDFVMALNSREHFGLVDDKLVTKRILLENGFPTPPLYAQARCHFEIADFLKRLQSRDRFVVKPSRGYGGAGISVVIGKKGSEWVLSSQNVFTHIEQRRYVADILYGVYSMDQTMDQAFAEATISGHPALSRICRKGIPDVRIIVCKGIPVAAMIRIGTEASGGKANLHAGGFAVGIDPGTGRTTDGWSRGKRIRRHPEADIELAGHEVPHWNQLWKLAGELREVFPLDYMGVDLSIDALRGPAVIELNARPGLEIQNVVGRGLRECMQKAGVS